MAAPLAAITTGFDAGFAAADIVGLLGAGALNDERFPPSQSLVLGSVIGPVLWQVAGKQAAARAYKPVQFRVDTSVLQPTISPTKIEAEVKELIGEAEEAARLSEIEASEQIALATAARPATYAVGLYLAGLIVGARPGLGDIVTIAGLGALGGTFIRSRMTPAPLAIPATAASAQ